MDDKFSTLYSMQILQNYCLCVFYSLKCELHLRMFAENFKLCLKIIFYWNFRRFRAHSLLSSTEIQQTELFCRKLGKNLNMNNEDAL